MKLETLRSLAGPRDYLARDARIKGAVTGLRRHAGLVASAAFLTALACTPVQADPANGQSNAARRVLPSVVSITIWKPNRAGAMEQFYGSGFVVDPSGLILTNHHVVDGAQSIEVGFSNGTRLSGALCAAAHLIDLAMVKVAGMGQVPAVTWGDSDKLVPGDGVLAIGNPLDVGESVSAGIVSALHRHTSANPFDDLIQTDAAINHGNSGGTMVNEAGEVVGVNTQFLSAAANEGALGIGFAIPSAEAMRVADRLKTCHEEPPGWVGITVQQVTPAIARVLGLSAATGSIVTGVAPDSPAQKSGIRQGDVIEKRDGKAAPIPLQLLGMIALTRVGTPVRLGYWRWGHTAEAEMTIAAWPGIDVTAPRHLMRAAVTDAMNHDGLGARFADRQGNPGEPRAIVSSVDPGSPAGDAGLQQGDVVLQIDQEPVSSVEGAHSLLREAELKGQHAVLLLVESGARRRWVVIPLGVG